MNPLRAKVGIDDYSWSKFRRLSAESQDEILLFLETLAPDFEKHPERWGSCLSMMARSYATAERWLAREREKLRGEDRG